MDEHQAVCAVKQLAQELGRTPSKQQFLVHVKGGRTALAHHFDDAYQNLLAAAGLAPNPNSKPFQASNRVFEKDIASHIGNYKPEPKYIRTEPWPNIMILGDMHEPFSSDKVKAEFVLRCEKENPAWIVQIGDCFDMYSWAKFPRSQNIFSPKEEEQLSKKRLNEFWSACKKAAPNAKLVQLTGNHDQRPLKRVLESLPQFEHWAELYMKDLLTFDGVTTVLDPRQEFVISDIVFIHGFMNKQGEHMNFLNANVVRGHDHRGGVVFKNLFDRTLWELDAGYAADPKAKGLTYTPSRINGWTQGWAEIDALGPRFCPL